MSPEFPCLHWKVYVWDDFDFLPRAIEKYLNPAKEARDPKIEFNVWLVWLAQQWSRCGWKEFYHVGESEERLIGKGCKE